VWKDIIMHKSGSFNIPGELFIAAPPDVNPIEGAVYPGINATDEPVIQFWTDKLKVLIYSE
jgi:hypothetical protein